MDQIRLTELVGHWLKLTYRNLSNYLDSRLQEYDLTSSQLGVLMLLWEQEGVTQKEIQTAVGVRSASLTFLIKGLDQKGLIVRKTDELDTRLNRVFLTEKSRALKEDCLQLVMETENKLAQGVELGKIEEMVGILKQCNKNILDE
ncbi:MarR family winged helix-turn-helix transcriptional regulator [Paenibacillus hexagrammi]|uniref:MarR family transcriptional regulator n=1 Tax=Paenibacillus hexagrammi TaxID=2908839 RepID=A0ABY3SIC8_9BACL|nr:MarR family transcriptional regulator [Paenibacillus sp. YPD9-1]UJF33779.1 MarR family transcriptional regulator [Paenibacillus sp. YPD9-1]